MVLSITALSGAPLFQCAVGDGVGTEDWGVLGGMIEVVRRTGHCSWYVEKGLQAVGEPERYRVHGGGGYLVLLPYSDVCSSISISYSVPHLS